MIAGKKKTEAEYRELPIDSSSSLKDFITDRRKYFKKYISLEKEEEEDNKATTIGKLVETLLFEPELFDDRFYMSSCISTPTEKMLDFVVALCDCTLQASDEDGNITKSFEEISKEAYALSGYKLSYEAVMKKFVDTDNEIYYKELRHVRSNKLIVVTTQDVTNAENIVEELKLHKMIRNIVTLQPDDRWDVYPQLQVENYEVDECKFKSMLDLVHVDHFNKYITPYDLKCVWNVEGFYTDYYLYRKAYIQAYLYKQALEYWKTTVGLDDYTVENLSFIVCDSGGWYTSLIYRLTDEDMLEAYNGFEYKERKYTGVKEGIEDLIWAKESNIWNHSKKAYSSNCILNIKD